MTLNTSLPIKFSPLHRLQWEEAQQKEVILYPEGMVELNQSSAEILKLCDGVRTLAEIVETLEIKFQTSNLQQDVINFLEDALKNGWIQQH
jgi:pyrroloquinoline quinone biosynthesis protein D